MVTHYLYSVKQFFWILQVLFIRGSAFSFLCMQFAQAVFFTNHTYLMTFDFDSFIIRKLFEAAIIVKKKRWFFDDKNQVSGVSLWCAVVAGTKLVPANRVVERRR
jgi:hypothetical protein